MNQRDDYILLCEKSGNTGGNEILRILVIDGQNTEIHDLGVDLKVFLVGMLKPEFTGTLNSTRLRFQNLSGIQQRKELEGLVI